MSYKRKSANIKKILRNADFKACDIIIIIMEEIKFPLEAYKRKTSFVPAVFNSKVPVLVCFSRFLADLAVFSPFLSTNSFEKTYIYTLSDFEKCSAQNFPDKDFYTFPYSINFFEHTFKGVVEIQSCFGEDCFKINIKIDFQKNFFENLCYYPILLKGVVAQTLLNQLFFQCLKRVSYEKEKNQLRYDYQILTTKAPDFLQKQVQKDIFQLLVHFYLTLKNQCVFIKTADILKFKKIKPEEIEKSIFTLEKTGVIVVLKSAFSGFKKEYSLLLNPAFFKSPLFCMPSKILCFNAKKELWERKVGEMFMYETSPLKIKKILFPLKEDCKSLKPAQVRQRLEDTLDNLAKQGIIDRWEYKFLNEKILKGRGWLLKYENLSVIFK